MAAVCAHGGMVRVVSVDDARTLTVEHGGQRERIQLAGVEITDPRQAAELLRWTIGTSWVLAEKHAGGGFLVYRSPDALFVNRELVVRGYARATTFGIEPESNLKVTYLGQVDAPFIALPRETGSDTSRRSTASPSRRTRRPPKSAPGRRAPGSAPPKRRKP
jgi:hypothetical protein